MFFNQPPQLSKENDENLKAREGEWGRDCKTEKRDGGVADLGLVEFTLWGSSLHLLVVFL